jgi:hypothetical protein
MGDKSTSDISGIKADCQWEDARGVVAVRTLSGAMRDRDKKFGRRFEKN